MYETLKQIAADFTPREVDLIYNCEMYAENDPAGLPGHNIMLIVAKLMTYTPFELSDMYEAMRIKEKGEMEKSR